MSSYKHGLWSHTYWVQVLAPVFVMAPYPSSAVCEVELVTVPVSRVAYEDEMRARRESDWHVVIALVKLAIISFHCAAVVTLRGTP